MTVDNAQTHSIRVVIVDDHIYARKKIESYLEDYDFIDVIGEASTGSEAVELCLATLPDVVFLDVQMPGLSGFECLEQLHLRNVYPHVVFVTAHNDYALDAFDVHAVDYLLKPVNQVRFSTAVEKIRRQIVPTPRSFVTEYRGENQKKQKLLVKTGAKSEVLKWNEVVLVTSENDLAEIWTPSRSYLTDQSLETLEASLPEDEFYRIHRSTICRLSYIKQLVTDGKGHYHVEYDHPSHDRLAVSRRRYAALKKSLTTLT